MIGRRDIDDDIYSRLNDQTKSVKREEKQPGFILFIYVRRRERKKKNNIRVLKNLPKNSGREGSTKLPGGGSTGGSLFYINECAPSWASLLPDNNLDTTTTRIATQ